MNWTNERVELLKKLWSDGLSATDIARQLGGVSRNAVIGKVHRLKLSGRPRGRTDVGRPTKGGHQNNDVHPAATATREHGEKRTADIPVTREIPRPIEAIVIPISRRLPIDDLSESTCRWPNGEPQSEEFSFCGHDASGSRKPYCAYHAKLAYQPASIRRSMR